MLLLYQSSNLRLFGRQIHCCRRRWNFIQFTCKSKQCLTSNIFIIGRLQCCWEIVRVVMMDWIRVCRINIRTSLTIQKRIFEWIIIDRSIGRSHLGIYRIVWPNIRVVIELFAISGKDIVSRQHFGHQMIFIVIGFRMQHIHLRCTGRKMRGVQWCIGMNCWTLWIEGLWKRKHVGSRIERHRVSIRIGIRSSKTLVAIRRMLNRVHFHSLCSCVELNNILLVVRE